MTVIYYCASLLLLNTYCCHFVPRPNEVFENKWKKTIIGKKDVTQQQWVHKPPKYMVITTWLFGMATQTAYDKLAKKNATAIDAVVEGCHYCEETQCDYTVGFGGSPDENGESTLDAMVFDGATMDVGAVAGLKRIKNAVGVARAVLKHTDHSILVGDAATQFAKSMGFKEELLTTNRSTNQWLQWRQAKCQPNFWKNVIPSSKTTYDPYMLSFDYQNYTKNTSTPEKQTEISLSTKKTLSEITARSPLLFHSSTICLPATQSRKGQTKKFTGKKTTSAPIPRTKDTKYYYHDTIGQIVLDSTGAIVAGTSSNGAIHKIPGRMGDAAIPGAGGYADKRYGAAVATGDGDIMMRFGPALAVVERLKAKISPEKATRQVINEIREWYPNFKGAVLAMSKDGKFSAACNGLSEFPFTVARSDWKDGSVKTYYIQC